MMKKIFPIWLFILILLLSSCEKIDNTKISENMEPTENLVRPAYEKSPVSFTETYGMVYDTASGWKSEYNGTTYCFTDKLSEEDRDSVILETDILIKIMEDMMQTEFEGYTLCMLEDNYLPRVKEKTLYIGFPNFKTQDFGIGICQMLLGNHVRYGLSYGLGRELSNKRGYSVESLAEFSDAIQLCDTSPEYLDLNYACFLEEYADASTLAKIKSIASEFCEWIMENKKERLFTNYSDNEYRACLSSFLTSHGKPEYTSTDLDDIWFYNGGENLLLIWEDPNAVFYVKKDFEPLAYHGELSDMIYTEYKNFRQLAGDYYKQSQFIDQNLSKYEENSEQKATVFFANQKDIFDLSVMGWYDHQENKINISNCTVFIHEYTHYILRDTSMLLWCNEMVARYYEYYPLNNQLSQYLLQLVYKKLKPNESDNPEDAKALAYIKTFLSHLGHEFQYNSLEDQAYYFHSLTAQYDLTYELWSDRANNVKFSFFMYLQELYGKELVLDAVIYNTPEKLSNKSWKELAYEWEEWLLKEYSWMEEFE